MKHYFTFICLITLSSYCSALNELGITYIHFRMLCYLVCFCHKLDVMGYKWLNKLLSCWLWVWISWLKPILFLLLQIAGKVNKIIRELGLRELGQLEQDLVFGDAGMKDVIKFLTTKEVRNFSSIPETTTPFYYIL